MTGSDSDFRQLIEALYAVGERLERLIPPPPTAPDFGSTAAFRWRGAAGASSLEPIQHSDPVRLGDLRCIDTQKSCVDLNTRQFLAGAPANNVLLWGARGTGKSTLVKALLNEYADHGLRLIEVDKQWLHELPTLLDWVVNRKERFIVFTDDLSFDGHDHSYRALKSTLDGSLTHLSSNVLVYATSNRRHLVPEPVADNEFTSSIDGELHHGEMVEEKISLSERFGLWIALHPFTQDQYLEIVAYWLHQLHRQPVDLERYRSEALRWALARGSRSGRVAWQFARDWCGRQLIAERTR